jgi:uncharacterized protein (TIGR02647 family)
VPVKSALRVAAGRHVRSVETIAHRGVHMPFSPELADELKVLVLFSPDTTQEGIKVHSRAEPALIAAARRLHEKGLVTRVDGGYLTALGVEAVEHLHALLRLLRQA